MDKKDAIKVIIADDHDIMLDGFSSILKNVDNITVVGTASTGREVITLLETAECDVLILDVNMPQLNGLETSRLLKKRNPATKIIILTMLSDALLINELVDLGIDGYLLKQCTQATLIEAIETVHSETKYFHEPVQKLMDRGYKAEFIVEDGTKVSLSKREMEIIKMIAMGLTNDEIAKQVFLSPYTVQTHRKNIHLKLGIHKAAELTAFAYNHGLIRK